MDEAAQYSIDVGELQRVAGVRLAEISGAESGMISTGASGSMALAAAACIAGTDPEKIWQLPDTNGLRSDIILWGGRSVFDSALRLTGGFPSSSAASTNCAAPLGTAPPGSAPATPPTRTRPIRRR